jgi:hypothetical protein
MELQEKSRFPMTLLAGVVIVLLVLGGAYFVLRHTSVGGPSAAKLPLGPDEQAYAAHIHFRELQMSRAQNFLNQEITYLFGEVANDGVRTIRDLEVTVEYRDGLGQVVLRDSQRPFGLHPLELPGGGRREFQLSFEHIPDEWNHQIPEIRVTGLLLE